MIKINLVAEKKTAKTKGAAPAATGLKLEGAGGSQNLLLTGILIVALAATGGWWWLQARETHDWTVKVQEAEAEYARLQEVLKKAELLNKQEQLLDRKAQLIKDLKKRQLVPVQILDQISKNLPEFLWLDSMEASSNQISISGRATTYNAVSNFYDNLSSSGYFTGVDLGKTSEAPEGVSFSLTCRFQQAVEKAESKPQG